MKRWKDNGYSMIGNLANHWTGEGDYAIPCNPAGEEMCLQIQLKGECKAGSHLEPRISNSRSPDTVEALRSSSEAPAKQIINLFGPY